MSEEDDPQLLEIDNRMSRCWCDQVEFYAFPLKCPMCGAPLYFINHTDFPEEWNNMNPEWDAMILMMHCCECKSHMQPSFSKENGVLMLRALVVISGGERPGVDQ
jgi:hypothetical protein